LFTVLRLPEKVKVKKSQDTHAFQLRTLSRETKARTSIIFQKSWVSVLFLVIKKPTDFQKKLSKKCHESITLPHR